jgi:hypothetical protein
MKQPVHSIQKADGHLVVLRLKEPRFSAKFYPDFPGELKEVKFANEVPANPEAYYKKALAAIKQFR